jgi:segregation and condensation protein A
MYEVKLELFEGPLDLLLHLVDRNQLDITEVSLASICGEYGKYLSRLRELNLEVESSFLTVFASLLEIKSRALLPSLPKELEEEEIDEHELVAQLREYRKMKESARELGEMKQQMDSSFSRGCDGSAEEEPVLASQLSVSDLFDAYALVLRHWTERGVEAILEITKDEVSFPFIIKHLAKKIRERAELYLHELFETPPDKLRFIIIFLALLEMARRRRVSLIQDYETRMITIINVNHRKRESVEFPVGEAVLAGA